MDVTAHIRDVNLRRLWNQDSTQSLEERLQLSNLKISVMKVTTSRSSWIEELKQEIKAMDGYEEQNWTTLRANMVKIWGDSHAKIQHTIQDLYNLVEETAREGFPEGLKEFKVFKSKFLMITKYLIANEHIRDQQDQAIKYEMVRSNLIPYGKDGYPKTPHLEDLMDVAQDKVQAAGDKTFIGTGFGKAD
ncbi:hypothetical protein VP01_4207g1 [Puccinia sorghi]|uniref:Uncharacterized protein n=1 Tax=Puccinia sorghi TaxID=27349 RepID=A0A0L6UQQ6_9BASI|nr:hypothetical protein VP01_4207g1 [Puccinia sorghi]